MKANGKHQTLKGRLAKHLLPNPGTLIILLLFILAQSAGAAPWHAPATAPGSTTTVNYQGRLFDSSGNPVNGNVTLAFSLYDQASGGNRKWGPETHTGVSVSDGLFSVLLGSRTADGIPQSALGGDLWLETSVNGETLSPREQLGAVPYAMQAGMALTVPNGSITTAKLVDHAVSDVDQVNSSAYHTLTPGVGWHDDPTLALTKNFDAGTLLIDVAVNGIWCNDSPQIVKARLLVDGQVKQQATVAFNVADYNETSLFLQWVQNVSAGQHHIRVQWVTWGNCRISNDYSARSLRVLNLKR